ncbi:MAG: hypothetical protein U0704_16660 [Candidatus Eisenbacteria bacterium]
MDSGVTQQQMDRLLALEAGDDVWQLRAARLSDWVEFEGEDRIVDTYVAVSREQRRVGMSDGVEWGAPRLAPAFAALLSLAGELKPARRPMRVEVDEFELHAELAPVLEQCGVGCELVEHAEEADDAVETLRRELGGAAWHPPLYTHVESARLRSLCDAFAGFSEARPWLRLWSVDFVRVESPLPEGAPAWFSLQGGVGVHKGLLFYRSESEITSCYDGSLSEDEVAEVDAWSVGLGSFDELAPEDRKRWKRERLPLLQGNELPVATRFQPGEGFVAIEPELLPWFEAVVRAISDSTEDDFDAARWERTVQAPEGAVTVRFALPQLLPPAEGLRAHAEQLEARRAWLDERTLRAMARAMEGRTFESPAEAQAFLRKALASGEPRNAAEPATPRERAEALIHEANRRDGRRRTQLARRAIAEWPDCADGYVVLAQQMPDRDLALAYWGEAFAAAVRAAGGEDEIEEYAGALFNALDLRPYLRARAGYGEALLDAGRLDEGARHLFELLRLDPSDPMGVAPALLAELAAARRWDAVESLAASAFAGTAHAAWIATLVAFARQGDTPATREAHAAAQRANTHVAKYLTRSSPLPDGEPDEARPGSDDEARLVALDLIAGWEAEPGAVAWLAALRKDARREGKAKRRKR